MYSPSFLLCPTPRSLQKPRGNTRDKRPSHLNLGHSFASIPVATHLKYRTALPRHTRFPHHVRACKYARESERERARASEQEREREREVCVGGAWIEGETESEGERGEVDKNIRHSLGTLGQSRLVCDELLARCIDERHGKDSDQSLLLRV